MAEYFSHDYTARSDPKIMNLIFKMGYEGYGIYWAILEQMYIQKGSIMRSQCECISASMQTHSDKMLSVLNDFDLFKTDGIEYWSESVLERISLREEKSEKAKMSAINGWKKRGYANAKRTQSERNANSRQPECDRNAIKEKKIKEKKEENKTKEKNSCSQNTFLKEQENQTFENGPEKNSGELKLEILVPELPIESVIKNFLEHRKKIKAPMTDLAIKLMRTELGKLSGGDYEIAKEILETSIKNGWKGIFPLKYYKKNNINSEHEIKNNLFSVVAEIQNGNQSEEPGK